MFLQREKRLSRISPEKRLRMQRFAYLMAAAVLVLGIYNGLTSSPPASTWLLAAGGVLAAANVAAACFADRIARAAEVAFDLGNAILLFGTAFATLEKGARHDPLAGAWTIAGALYVGLAVRRAGVFGRLPVSNSG